MANDPSDTNGDQTPNAEIWITSVTGDTTFGTPTTARSGGDRKERVLPGHLGRQPVTWSSTSPPATGRGPPAGEAVRALPLRRIRRRVGDAAPGDRHGRPARQPHQREPERQLVELVAALLRRRTAPSRGDNLYWVAFSSRHPYGATLPGTDNPPTGDTEPQLWFAAVTVDPSGNAVRGPELRPGVDAPAEPDRNVQRGNHSPQWVTKAVPVLQ
jgi:hypothetical protein